MPFERVDGFHANVFTSRPKDVVASMIKRLAHRNANVQIYTLEVCYFRCSTICNAHHTRSSRMPCHRIVAQRCIGNSPQEASQTLCCDWLAIEYALMLETGRAQWANTSKNTHQQVKTKILERMAEWTEMFSKDRDLGIMEQAYMKLKSQSTSTYKKISPIMYLLDE